MTTKPATLDIPADLDYSDPLAVAKVIRTALRARSGKTWSVRSARGTAYGWLDIAVPDSRWNGADDAAYEAEQTELSTLLGFSGRSSHSVGNSTDYRREYVARACGHVPSVHGVPYWD